MCIRDRLLGAAANLILDPIFIFGLDMGIQGAALATVISQALSAAWILWFLTGKKAILRLKLSCMKPELKRIKEITSLGMSGFTMAITNCTVQVVCNATLQVYGGDLYVGIMTVINSLRAVSYTHLHGCVCFLPEKGSGKEKCLYFWEKCDRINLFDYRRCKRCYEGSLPLYLLLYVYF